MTRPPALSHLLFLLAMMLAAPAAQGETAIDSPEALCAAFDGRPYGYYRGETRFLKCEQIRRIEAAVERASRDGPLAQAVGQMRQATREPFLDTLGRPERGDVRRECGPDPWSETGGWICGRSGVLARYRPDAEGVIREVEVAIPGRHRLLAPIMRAAAETLGQADASPLVQQVVLHAMAVRRPRPGEVVQTDGTTLFLKLRTVPPR
jgi:hypothetical protein